MLNLPRKNQKGFTLIEVMLVVLIIGIIAIIALPKLLVTIRQAKNRSCLSNLQAIKTANEQCKWTTGAYGTGGDLPALITFLEDPDGDSTTDDAFLPASSAISGTCPSGGTITYDSDTGSLTCSEHTDLTTDVADVVPTP